MSVVAAHHPTAAAPAPEPSAPPEEAARTARAVDRTRRIAASVVLTVLAMVQAPDRIAPDTKLDLSIDPVGFLARSWHVWEPLGAFGQLQNQAYGYWLPMGPFFVLGHLAGLPAWLVQRLWWALLLLVAFHGTLALAGRLGLGTPGTRLIAAFAYALSPRILSELGGISVEAWPSAIAPWALLPLVRPAPGRARTAAARSGLAVALAGGVNAIAVGAVLLLPAWWLATRARTRENLRLAAWWACCVLLAITWWLVPLLVLGRYSPPFLDWIESAAVTTATGSPAAALRGTSHWLPWIADSAGPVWPAANAMVTRPVFVALIWVVAGLGVLGLLRRDVPHRTFLAGAVVGGLVLLTLGHAGPLSPPWDGALRSFLDGAGAALRNVHKFDLVVRLPLALGLAHLLASVHLPAVQGARWTRHGLRIAAVAAVAGLGAPALAGALPARGSALEIPGYWRDVATWLDEHPDGGRALVVPGAPFSSSLWGDLRDEPLQPLANTPWAVRDIVPLSSAGNIRLLTRVEQVLASGRGSAGLAEVLHRAGVSRLVVRADLAGVPDSTPRPVTVRSALSSSPGLHAVASFGPAVGATTIPGRFLDAGLQPAVPAVEIWQVDGERPGAVLLDARSAVRVSGGTEALLDLADAGLLGDRPTVLTGDPQASALAGAPVVLTDTAQRREADFSKVRDVWSPVLTATAPWRRERAAHDWLPFPLAAQDQTVAVWSGIEDVTASDPAWTASPWALFDDDPQTLWSSRPGALGQSLTVTFPEPTEVPGVVAALSSWSAPVAAFDVTTDTGVRRTPVDPLPALGVRQAALEVPPGPTRTLTLTVAEVRPLGAWSPLVLAGLALKGITVSRTLDVPGVRGDAASAVTLHEPRDGTTGCAFLGGRPLCGDGLGDTGEASALDREVSLGAGALYQISATGRPRADARWDGSLAPLGRAVRATASSRRSNEPAERAQAAVDGDLGTAWVAYPLDRKPTLTLRWDQRRIVGAIRLLSDGALGAARATRIRVSGGGTSYVVPVGADGWAFFEPVRTRRLVLQVLDTDGATTTDQFSTRGLPVGISEVEVPALDDLVQTLDSARGSGLPCGYGPTLELGGVTLPTRVEATVGQILRREEVRVVPCDRIAGLLWLQGATRISARDDSLVEPVSLTLRSIGATAPVPGEGERTPVALDLRSAARRTADVAPADHDRVLAVPENVNDGWRAVLDGQALQPVRLDGWMQGWMVPAGAHGRLVLTYGPQRAYRGGLVGGAVLLVLLGALAVLRRRRPVPVPGPSVDPAADPAVGPAADPGAARRTLAWLSVLTLGVLAGVAGLVAVLVTWRLRTSRRRAAVAGAGLALAAVVTTVSRTPTTTGVAGWLSGAGVLLVAAGLAAAARDGAVEPGDGAAEPGDGAAEPGDGSVEPGGGAAEPVGGSAEPVGGWVEPA